MRFTPITRNNRFLWLYHKGKSKVSPSIVVYTAKNRSGIIRIGITAGKKIGGAVVRNRAKRVIRAAISPLYGRLLPSHDYVFVARTRTPRLKSHELSHELEKLMSEGGMLEKNRSSDTQGL